MGVDRLFRHQDVALPKRRDDGDYERYLATVFQAYLQRIDTLSGDSLLSQGIRNSRNTIEQLGEHIINTIGAHFRGQFEDAYQHLRAGFELVRDDVETLVSIPLNASQTGLMCRVRLDAPKCPKKPDLFHVPFELRHKVRGYRYSAAGVPCLYLGGSLRVCWLELGGPRKPRRARRMTACRLECANGATIRVLNFGYRPSVIADLLSSWERVKFSEDNYRDFIRAYAACWPLIAASSIRPMHKETPFVPEYIVPQMTIQWVLREYKEHQWDGIRYFSTEMVPKLRQGEVDDFVYDTVNFAFPTRTQASRGHCATLLGKFRMSELISAFIRKPRKQLPELEVRLQKSVLSAISDSVAPSGPPVP